MQSINCCCNIIWLLLFGWILFVIWIIFGEIYCLTLLGYSLGVQAFKIGCFALWPFGKKVIITKNKFTKCEWIRNIIWIIFGGSEIAFISGILSIFCFITIVGMPFGVQLCKLTKLAFLPFGCQVVDDEIILTPFDGKDSIQNNYIPSPPNRETSQISNHK